MRWIISGAILAGALFGTASVARGDFDPLHAGMQWTGTFKSAHPDVKSSHNVAKTVTTKPLSVKCRLKITSVDGAHFKGEFRWFREKTTAAEFEGTVTTNGEFHLKFTNPVKGTPAATSGGALTGKFSRDAQTIDAAYMRPSGGRAGSVDATLDPEPSPKKKGRKH